jgi:hypothetical protein
VSSDTPHCKVLVNTTVAPSHNYTLKNLDALFATFNYLYAHFHGIARPKSWDV